VAAVTRTGAELARLLGDLRPAEPALRDWVRTRLDASIVRELADLDHGMRGDEHRRGIEELLAVNRLPEELPWTPREVLELASHAVPADERRHVARLFACLVLVRAGDTLVPAGTLAGLVESALELGPEATEQAVRYLAWCRLHEPGVWRDDDEALPFLTLGVLLSYAMAPGPLDPAVVGGLTRAFVADVETALPREQWWPDETPTALLKATAGAPGWRIWRALAGRCLIGGADGSPDRLALLDNAIRSRTTVSVGTLRTWFRIDDAPPSGR
jgi:hypothetical protein